MKFEKMKIQVKRLVLLIIATFYAFNFVATSGRPTIKARLDSAHVLMGRLTGLNLEVVTDKGAKGYFPLFNSQDPAGVVRTNGDSVELRTAFKSDTVELGSGRIQINYKFPVQVFDSGMYRLPSFVYVSGNDTAKSNLVTLKVIPLTVGDAEQISDYLGVEDGDRSFWDFIPDVLIEYWWAFLGGLIILGLLVWGLIRHKKQPETKSHIVLTPYELAIKHLHELKEKKLWEQGHEREYFTELTDILRIYLQDRFGVNAMEMTTDQIIKHLTQNGETKDKKSYLQSILEMADFVKFAKMRPLPSDNVDAYENAIRFVEETKPVDDDNSAEEEGRKEDEK